MAEAPHDLDAERSLLSALAVDAHIARASINGGLTVDAFYKPAHGIIYEAVTQLDDADLYVDVGVITDHLRQRGLLDTIGGVPGLLDACRLDRAIPPERAGQYAEIIARLHRRRRLQADLDAAARDAAAGDLDAAVRRARLTLDRHADHPGDSGHASSLVDWSTFWTKDRTATEWALDPLWPRGRAINHYAPRGLGKSELTLYAAAALASGRPVFGHPQDPLSIIYLDFEMGEDDLYDRLTEFGYGPTDDLANLHYYVLPALPPLNTPDGATAVMDLRSTHAADVIITDTLARIATGEENSNDTWISLGTHTILRLKAEGTTSVWLGHAGKDLERGERGGSAKGDAVDVIWEQARGDSGAVRLTNKKRRSSWVPETVGLRRVEQRGVLRYELADDVYPTGTGDVVNALDRLDAPDSITNRAARALLRDHDIGARSDALAAAVKWRRRRPAGAPRNGFRVVG